MSATCSSFGGDGGGGGGGGDGDGNDDSGNISSIGSIVLFDSVVLFVGWQRERGVEQ